MSSQEPPDLPNLPDLPDLPDELPTEPAIERPASALQGLTRGARLRQRASLLAAAAALILFASLAYLSVPTHSALPAQGAFVAGGSPLDTPTATATSIPAPTAGDASLATATSAVPTATTGAPLAPTATSVPPAPTSTPLPPPTPTPTPTPTPIQVSFPCASAAHSATDDPGVYRATICVATSPAAPGATLPLTVHYCASQSDDVLSINLAADGTQTVQPMLTSHCPTPLTVTLTASGASGGHPFAGSMSFTATS